MKVDILETLLTQQSAGELSGSDQALAQSMIEDSDNDSATDLWDAVGGAGGIRSFDAKAGLAHTTPSPCVECAGFPWPGWGLTTTTPADQIALLRQIAVPGGLLEHRRARLRRAAHGERHAVAALGRVRRRPAAGHRRAEERLAAAQRAPRRTGRSTASAGYRASAGTI